MAVLQMPPSLHTAKRQPARPHASPASVLGLESEPGSEGGHWAAPPGQEGKGRVPAYSWGGEV